MGVHVVAPALRAKSEHHSGDKSSSCLQTGGPKANRFEHFGRTLADGLQSRGHFSCILLVVLMLCF